ncbi:MAG: hypothetical protein ACRDJM_08360 [Actinomycetota bacterium]
MRNIGRVALVAAMAFAVFASLGTPAYAVPAGGGTVGGTVKITNVPDCIPVATAPPAPVTYTFNDVIIPGVFATSEGQAFAGQIDVANVKGASVAPHDNTVMGQGTVNSSTDRATFTGSSATTITGTFFGKYLRVGSVVLVDLDVAFRVNGGPQQTTKVSVAAHFQPTNGDGVVQPVCEAAFGGVYATADNPAIG